MMYWPWGLIGENMQLCLAGLRDVDRSVLDQSRVWRVTYGDLFCLGLHGPNKMEFRALSKINVPLQQRLRIR